MNGDIEDAMNSIAMKTARLAVTRPRAARRRTWPIRRPMLAVGIALLMLWLAGGVAVLSSLSALAGVVRPDKAALRRR